MAASVRESPYRSMNGSSSHIYEGTVGLELLVLKSSHGEPYEKAYFSAENKVVPPGMSSSDLRRRDLALHRKIMFHEFGLTLPHLSYNYLHE